MYGYPVLQRLLEEAINEGVDFCGDLLQEGFCGWRERRRTRRTMAKPSLAVDPLFSDEVPGRVSRPLAPERGPDLYFWGLISSCAVWIFLELGFGRFAERQWHFGRGHGGASTPATIVTIIALFLILGMTFVGVLTFAAACERGVSGFSIRERIAAFAGTGFAAAVGVALWVLA